MRDGVTSSLDEASMGKPVDRSDAEVATETQPTLLFKGSLPVSNQRTDEIAVRAYEAALIVSVGSTNSDVLENCNKVWKIIAILTKTMISSWRLIPWQL